MIARPDPMRTPGKGYYMRVLPDRYTNTRVQVYVHEESGDPEFNPGDDIGVPADTNAQRLGFGNAGTGDGGYSDDNIEVSIEYKCKHGLSNQKVIDALQALAKKLGADNIVVTGGDRTREEEDDLRNSNHATTTHYENCTHGDIKGNIAADVRFYKDGNQIDTDIVGDTVRNMDIFGGVGYYDDFNHVDLRPRKPDGDIHKWGNWEH